jgi:O-antigen ligase
LDKYLTSKENPESNSLAQRFEFWKTAGFLFVEHPIFGVGTGDIMEEMKAEYETSGSQLSARYRLRPHNQFLTTAASFGLFGLLYFLAVWLVPLFAIRNRPWVCVAFWVIAVASMVFEDTLETQLGATFISLFYALLLGFPFRNSEDSKPFPD